ncbi:MAG: PQQ-dependent dehydrogenase, methanol/ethanol family [Acidobacteria bacterium]|nr:PQQ-dependent dehydrogenase, methanol/ethanol family [Acidobacteriota bacterium]
MRAVSLLFAACSLYAQVTYDRLLKAADEPGNWLTYHGQYSSIHHSKLAQITPANVKDLELKWVVQAKSLEKHETTPIVVDGVMYITEAPNVVVALDAATGREFWTYEHPLPDVTYPCCGRVNRGLAILGNTLYLGTHDAKLIAIDASTGQKRWETVVTDYKKGYALALAPLIVKDKVIVGTAGGELGIRGFLAAYDAKTGKEVWRFKIIPEPGEKGNETWGGDSWKYGGGSIWLTGSYDPDTNLTYWGTGNPGPDWNPAKRPGDNLYTDSAIALDADTGKLKWHFQFTPHDEWDWDSVQTPVLVDHEYKGKMRKLLLWANRNGFYYVFDRVTGQFLSGTPFVKQNWAVGLDEMGRPVKAPGRGPSAAGTVTFPGVQGGTNWFAPSYSPVTKLFYLNTWDDYSSIFFAWDQDYEQGKWYAAGGVKAEVQSASRDRLNRRNPGAGYGATRALDPVTGKKIWEFRTAEVSESGILTTASNVLFTGNREGHFMALDATNGKLLWRKYLSGMAASSPITFLVNGKQYVTVAIGQALFCFGLRD